MIETYKKSKTSTNPMDSLANHLGTSVKKLNNEIKKNLEQIRALENSMKIDVGFVEDMPLSVDTENDLKKIKNQME